MFGGSYFGGVHFGQYAHGGTAPLLVVLPDVRVTWTLLATALRDTLDATPSREAARATGLYDTLAVPRGEVEP